MTAQWHLPLLLAGIRDAFFRLVSCSFCLLNLKTRVPNLAGEVKAFLPEDSDSNLPTYAPLLRCVHPIFFVVLLLLVVLGKGVHFAAAADDCGW